MKLIPFAVREGEYGVEVEVLSDKTLERGKLLIIDGSDGGRWIARVHASESLSMAKTPLEAIVRHRQYDYAQQKVILEFVSKHVLSSYAINRAKIICEVGENGLTYVRRTPTVDCSIREAQPSDLERHFQRDIVVGRHRELGFSVGIPKALINKHIGIMGKSGIGKTNLACFIAASLYRHANIIAIDYEADLSKLLAEWAHYNVGEYGKILAVSREIPYSERFRMNPSDFFVSDWENIGVVSTRPQVWVMTRFQRKGEPWLMDFLNGRDTLPFDDQKSWDAIERRLMPIIECEVFDHSAPMYSLFNTVRSIVEGRLRFLLLELGEISGNMLALCLIVNYIARILNSLRRDQRLRYGSSEEFERSTRPIVLLIDEAQKVLAPEMPSAFLRGLIHTARKNNISIFLVTQYPSAIDIDVLKGLQTKMIMRLEHEEDINAAVRSTPFISKGDIEGLGLGDAILYADSSFGGYPFSVPISTPKFNPRGTEAASSVPESPILDRIDERIKAIKDISENSLFHKT